jgi:hypothetical protein
MRGTAAFAQCRVAVATCLSKSPFAFCSCEDTRQYTAVPAQTASPPCGRVLDPWHSMVAKAIRHVRRPSKLEWTVRQLHEGF